MKSQDPNSARAKRRANRKIPFTGSRPVRRAARRLAGKLADYERTKLPEYNKPGAIKHW